VRDANVIAKGLRSIVRKELMYIAVDGFRPVVVILRNSRIVRFVDTEANGSRVVLVEIARDAFGMLQVALSWCSMKGREGHNC